MQQLKKNSECFKEESRTSEGGESQSSWFSHMGFSMEGLGIIHAYGKENYITTFKRLNDENSCHLFYFNCAHRWLALRMDVLMNILTFAVALIVTLNFSSLPA
nr:multidrug resistance-associated protein 9-like [Aotus nancymaae]